MSSAGRLLALVDRVGPGAKASQNGQAQEVKIPNQHHSKNDDRADDKP